SQIEKTDVAELPGPLADLRKPIGLSTRLRDVIDINKFDVARFVEKGTPNRVIEDFRARLGDLQVEDLLTMNAPGPAWNEGYDGNIKTSNVVGMLWLEGQRDMASYAAAHLLDPMVKTPRFRYSSGNAVILMRALKEVYGELYAQLPFVALF